MMNQNISVKNTVEEKGGMNLYIIHNSNDRGTCGRCYVIAPNRLRALELVREQHKWESNWYSCKLDVECFGENVSDKESVSDIDY